MKNCFDLIKIWLVAVIAVSSAGVLAANDERFSKAQALHQRLLTLDAHVDIEIPGQPSSYVGEDGRSKVEPNKMEAG